MYLFAHGRCKPWKFSYNTACLGDILAGQMDAFPGSAGGFSVLRKIVILFSPHCHQIQA